MSDEQIEQAIEAIQDMLEQRAGEAAKIIEGTAEPAALPAPEAQSIGAGLEPKRQRRPNRLVMQADTAVGPQGSAYRAGCHRHGARELYDVASAPCGGKVHGDNRQLMELVESTMPRKSRYGVSSLATLHTWT